MHHLLLIAALMFGGYAWSVPPVTGKAETANERKQEATNHNEQSITLPSSLNLNVSGKLEVHTDNSKNNGNQESSKWFEPITLFTLLLVVVGGLQAHFLFGTVKATGIAANASRDSVVAMRDNAKKELRAYLGVIRGHVEVLTPIQGTSKTRYKVFVDISNSGKTPAKNVRRAVDAKLLKLDHSVFESTVEDNNWDIAPNGPFWSLVKPLDLTNEEVVAINDKKMSIFIWGKATYKDIFGRGHEIGFRYRSSDQRLPNGWYFEPEPEGNYSKDGE